MAAAGDSGKDMEASRLTKERSAMTPRASSSAAVDDVVQDVLGNGSAKQSDLDAEVSEDLPRTLAVVVLGLVTILWGAQHVVIRSTLGGADGLEASVLNTLRFGLAALCFSPWLPPLPPLSAILGSGDASGEQGTSRMEWRGGAELGFWLFLGFGLQTVGLLYTTAQRSGLLLYLNVKLVPFFALCFFNKEVSTSAWVSAAIAFLGTFLVAGDGAGGVPPNVGDALSLAAAGASAFFILRLDDFASKTEARALNAVSMLVVALLCVPWVMAEAALDAWPDPLWDDWQGLAAVVADLISTRVVRLCQDHWDSILYLGVGTTAFTSWLQTLGQRSVPATTASVIYALDPLWGCLFAYIFLGEVLGPQGLFGCMMLLGIWAYQLVAMTDSEEVADQVAKPAASEA